jgi:hypothetical protein
MKFGMPAKRMSVYMYGKFQVASITETAIDGPPPWSDLSRGRGVESWVRFTAGALVIGLG